MTNDSFELAGNEDDFDAQGQRLDQPTMEYIMHTFLNVDDVGSHPIALALANDHIFDVNTLLSLKESDIGELREPYQGAKGRMHYRPLSIGNAVQLRWFIRFGRHLSTERGAAVSNNHWCEIRKDKFNDFRTQETETLQSPPTPRQSSTSATSSAPSDFSESIRRDETHYEEYNEENEHYSTGVYKVQVATNTLMVISQPTTTRSMTTNKVGTILLTTTTT